MAVHLRVQRIRPELVLVSSSRRARQTLKRITPALPRGADVRIERALYLADDEGLLDRLHRVRDKVGSAMVIAHNPGMQDLVAMLAGRGEEMARVAEKFPTGALATLEFDGDWVNLRPGGARLVSFVTPRDLEGDT